MMTIRDQEATRWHRLQVAAAVLALLGAGVAYGMPASQPAPCAVLDLGDVVLCAQRVAGVEPDGFGGAILTSALDGVRIDYATDLDVETVARRLRAVR